jgi:predicted dehydrogenase
MSASVRGAGLHVGVVGLGFGSDFLPIYLRHPAVREVSIADTDPVRLAAIGDAYGVARRHDGLDSLLADPDVDAVHLLAPVRFHAPQSIAVLEAGKHCACAVPMATTLEDLDAIIAAQERSGRQYMMMETTVFSREYFYVRSLLDSGVLGDLTFYRGFHLQDLDGFPSYWRGYPPMHYLTHALSPALALTSTTVEAVQCLGSGRLTPERRGDFDNPFPLEVGLFRLRGHDMAVDITLSFFQTARAYTEGFSVYGSQVGVEWPTAEGGPLAVHEFGPIPEGGRGRSVVVREVEPPDRADLLPPEVAGFTRPGPVVPAPGLAPVEVGAGHGGSHPHLVHEFLTAIVNGRAPLPDARTSAAWTAAGICAHQSALAGGELVAVPDFAAPVGARR